MNRGMRSNGRLRRVSRDHRAQSFPDAESLAAAWREFRRVGERLAATSNGVSITQAISDMRR